jgi:uncharacterized membrane protein YeaQ/YmgE (transglycosylase-associated protein family)
VGAGPVDAGTARLYVDQGTLALMLWELFAGLIVGAIARLVMPGKVSGGILITMGLGVAGAFLATIAGRLLHWYEPGERAGWIASVLGALVLLWIYRAYLARRTRPL